MKLGKNFHKKFNQFLSIFCILTMVACNFPVQIDAENVQGEEPRTEESQQTNQNQTTQKEQSKEQTNEQTGSSGTAAVNNGSKEETNSNQAEAKAKDANKAKTSNLKKGTSARSFTGQPLTEYGKTVVPDDDTVILGSFALKFIPGKTTVETFGQGWNSVSGSEVGFIGADHEDQKGKIGLVYKNVGTYDGQVINLRIVINDWSQFSTKKNGLIKYRTNTIGTSTQKYNWVDQTWKFEYQDGGKAELKNTYMTWYDIDQLQYMTFDQKSSNEISHIYASKDNQIHYSNEDQFGTTFFAPTDKDTNDDDKTAMYTTLFDNTSEVRFKWGKDYSNMSPEADLGNGEFLGFSAKKIARTQPDAPTKKVTDKNEINEESNELFNVREKFKYTIYQTVPDEYPEYYYGEFKIDDTINPNLKVDQVKVYNVSDQDVTDEFDIQNDGNHYTVSAKKEFLADPGFYYNTYRVEFDVQIDPSKEQTPGEGGQYSYSNVATATITSENKTFVNQSNEVQTWVERQDLSFQKIWEDFNDLYHLRPSSITVDLYQSARDDNGQVVQSPTKIRSIQVSPDKDNNWGGVFEHLDTRDDEGNFYDYKLKDSVPGYTSIYDDAILTNELDHLVTITAKKIWQDNNDEFGKRPDYVMIDLYRQTDSSDRTRIDSRQVDQTNNWTYEFTDLEKYDENGKPYQYFVDEEDVPEDYQKKIEGNNIINTFVGTQTISGQKKWEDDNDANKARPAEVTIHLLANGQVKATKTVTAADDWKYEFKDQPLLGDDGKKINYTISEDSVKDYSTEIKGFDVTNTYSPGKTSLTVTKNWQDNSNQDNIRPSKVEIQLLANGQKQGDPITLNSENKWTYTWQDLVQASQGKKIKYTVQELTTAAGYDTKIDDSNSGNVIVTNSHTPATTAIRVAKIWNDNNNKELKRPNKITVQLFQNGVKAGDPVELNPENMWIYEWENLPEYLNGKQVEYTVKEVDVPAWYQSTTSSTNGKTFIITNTYQTSNTNNGGGNNQPQPPADGGNVPSVDPSAPVLPPVTPDHPKKSHKKPSKVKIRLFKKIEKTKRHDLPVTGRGMEIGLMLIGILLLLMACSISLIKFKKKK